MDNSKYTITIGGVAMTFTNERDTLIEAERIERQAEIAMVALDAALEGSPVLALPADLDMRGRLFRLALATGGIATARRLGWMQKPSPSMMQQLRLSMFAD